jgi:hypothetical protein
MKYVCYVKSLREVHTIKSYLFVPYECFICETTEQV